MKIKCISQSGQTATFLLPGREKPQPGNYYTLEKYAEGTAAQRKTFHSILFDWYNWMFRQNKFIYEDAGVEYDFTASDPHKFKEMFKYRYCDALDRLKYVDDNGEIGEAKTWEDVPLSVLNRFNAGKWRSIEVVTKSWNDFGKRRQSNAIDMLIMCIAITGCDDKRVQERLRGLEK